MGRQRHIDRTMNTSDARPKMRISLCVLGEIRGGFFLGCHAPRKLVPTPASTVGSRHLSRSRLMPSSRTCASKHRLNACSPGPFQSLADRVAPLGNVDDRIAIEPISEIAYAHHGLVASKLANKASTKHEAIHSGLGHCGYFSCGLPRSMLQRGLHRIHFSWIEVSETLSLGWRLHPVADVACPPPHL